MLNEKQEIMTTTEKIIAKIEGRIQNLNIGYKASKCEERKNDYLLRIIELERVIRDVKAIEKEETDQYLDKLLTK